MVYIFFKLNKTQQTDAHPMHEVHSLSQQGGGHDPSPASKPGGQFHNRQGKIFPERKCGENYTFLCSKQVGKTGEDRLFPLYFLCNLP